MKRAIGLVAISMLVLAACSDSSTGDDAERETTTATDSANAPADGESVSITILGTSDVHGRYMPWDYTVDVENTGGSLTQIATAVKEIQADEDNTILVDIGDLIQDNASELFQDMDEHPGVAVINELGYDVWTMGNHEFDYGMEKLDNIVEQFDGTVLGGNLYTEAGEQYWDGSTVIERGGVKIGIVGLTTPMVYEFKEETDTFDGLEFKPTIDEAKKAIDELGEVDAVVGVIHMGVENENNVPDTGVADIIAQVPEFDVIFAGHARSGE